MYKCSSNDYEVIEKYLLSQGKLINGDRCIFLNLELDKDVDVVIVVCSNKEKTAINICPSYTLGKGAEMYMERNNLNKKQLCDIIFEKIKHEAFNYQNELNSTIAELYGELEFCEDCEIS